MSEAGWLQIATLITSMITGIFVLWINSKSKEAKESLEKMHEKTNTVIKQNETQSEQIGEVHQEVNGRLKELVDAAVETALNKGIIQGIMKERERVAEESKK